MLPYPHGAGQRRLAGAVLLLLGLLPLAARAQIVDDSTRVLYGPKSTFYIREVDVLRDTITPRMVDTTLTRLPQQRYWLHDSTFQQDLGNLGTATRPLLWQPNRQLGARLGRNVFDKYVVNPATIPYYDTRSPYSYFRFMQGSTGESVFEISYNRSISKNASFGVSYERFSTNKILATVSGKDGLMQHTNVLAYFRYVSEDNRYHALFNFTTARHNFVEQGGIKEDSTLGQTVAKDSLYNYQRSQVWLTKASNRDDRDQLHLAHTYRLLGRGLTAFHVLDYTRQYNRFTDDALPKDGGRVLFYPAIFHNSTKTNDQASYHQVENTVGILGSTPTVEYRLYARRRDAKLESRSLYTTVTGTDSLAKSLPTYTTPGLVGQVFVGGTAAFQYRQFAVQTAGEYLLLSGEYWAQGTARLGPLSGELLSSSYSPTLTQQAFSGNHYVWENPAFLNTKINQLTVRLDQTLRGHRLQASGAVVNINSLVYYDQNARPAQQATPRQLLVFSARHRFQLGNFHTDNQATFTTGDNDTEIRIPALVANLRLYYQNYLFKNALFGQVGAEMYYQSRFRAYDYSPSIQQFYLQDHFTIRSYPLVDVFLTGDIKTVAVFLKVAYVNQGLYRDGYFASPFYTGLPRRFQFGVRWQFFN